MQFVRIRCKLANETLRSKSEIALADIDEATDSVGAMDFVFDQLFLNFSNEIGPLSYRYYIEH